MSREPATIQGSATVGEAARLMRDRDIGILPVMDGERMVGVVTDRDLVVRALAEPSFGDSTVGTIATKSVCVVAPGDDESHAASLMSKSEVRRLFVEHRGKLVGVVSVGDLAVRSGPAIAGEVMEDTGPEMQSTHGGGGRHWPGAELTRNTVSNQDEVSDERLNDDVQRDISQSGVTPTT